MAEHEDKTPTNEADYKAIGAALEKDVAARIQRIPSHPDNAAGIAFLRSIYEHGGAKRVISLLEDYENNGGKLKLDDNEKEHVRDLSMPVVYLSEKMPRISRREALRQLGNGVGVPLAWTIALAVAGKKIKDTWSHSVEWLEAKQNSKEKDSDRALSNIETDALVMLAGVAGITNIEFANSLLRGTEFDERLREVSNAIGAMHRELAGDPQGQSTLGIRIDPDNVQHLGNKHLTRKALFDRFFHRQDKPLPPHYRPPGQDAGMGKS